MEDSQQGWSLEELVERTGVPSRTIRYYITERLLPGPGARGKAASYDEGHLLRLRLIRRLTEQHQPLPEIGRRLAGLSLEELRALEAEDEAHEAILRRIADTHSPKEYVAALLERAQHIRPASPVRPEPIEATDPPVMPRHAVTTAGPPRTWHRWELAPGVELHVRDDGEDSTRRSLVERILQVAEEFEWPAHQRTPRTARPTVRRKAQQ